jgi:hypothetical protein
VTEITGKKPATGGEDAPLRAQSYSRWRFLSVEGWLDSVIPHRRVRAVGCDETNSVTNGGSRWDDPR